MPDLVKCEVCGTHLKSASGCRLHVVMKHGMVPQAYYDKYLRKAGEGICKVCGGVTTFYSCIKGYAKVCGHCGPKTPEARAKISLKNKGKVRTPEMLKRASEQRKGCPGYWLGKHRSIETCRKIGDANRGRTFTKKRGKLHRSEESRRKQSLAQLGRIGGMKGKTHSESTRQKMREAHRNRVIEQKLHGENTYVGVGKQERSFLDVLQALTSFVIIRQFPVHGFFVDGYIKDLNIAIEFDEDYHRNPDVAAHDAYREACIRKVRSCEFFRVDKKQWEITPASVKERFLQLVQRYGGIELCKAS